jgi:integrase
MIPSLPWSVKSLKVQKRPRAILPVNLARRWLAAIDTFEGDASGVPVAVRLMIGIGLREAETITARWEWVDWDRRTYTPGITKGREADPLPLPEWLYDFLATRRSDGGLMVHKPSGIAYGPSFTRKAMLAANKECNAGHITAHRLRGTFATLLSEEGAPVQMIQRALRHKSVNTTMAYLEVNMSIVAAAQQRIARRTGLDAAQKPKPSGENMANIKSDMPVK